MRSATPAFRYACYYGAVFLSLGVFLPFWPVWLSGRGLSAGEIGLLFGLASWIKVASSPAIAQVADRTGRTQAVLTAAAAATLACFAGFWFARGFWPILAVTLLSASVFHALIPLGEGLTMRAVLRDRLDYGRIRLWGSLTFILGTVGAGSLLTGRDPDFVLWLVLGALALTLAASAWLPRDGDKRASLERRGLGALLGHRRYLLFLLAASLLQASHAVYYGFSALHWKAAGLSESAIGVLWAEGVVAEVALFAVSGAALARLGPAGLLVAAGLAGALRWSVLGATTALPALFAVQALHALTFGAAHLGAMHFIARTAPPELSATAQSVYSAVSGGIAMGLALLLAGRLYAAYAGSAFLAMAALSLAGLLAAIALARVERGVRTAGPE